MTTALHDNERTSMEQFGYQFIGSTEHTREYRIHGLPTESISAAPILAQHLPGRWVLVSIIVYDNDDIGWRRTFRARINIYEEPDCNGSSMMLYGCGESGPWHSNISTATQEACLSVLAGMSKGKGMYDEDRR